VSVALKPNAVRELYFSIYGSNPTNFTAQLYHLIGKADGRTRARLRLAFPDEVNAWEAWQTCGNEKQFFDSFFPLAPRPIPKDEEHHEQNPQGD
jgi:hypothetical protein